MPRRKEESSDEEEESEEEESEDENSSDEDGSEDDDEGSDDSDGSEEDSEEEEGSEDDDSEDDEDETPRSKKKQSKKKNSKSDDSDDGLLNISLTIDKESGKVVSSKVEEKRKENASSPLTNNLSTPPVETSTQTDYNMFFPPLSEALYQASTNSQRKDELLNQAKRILLAPDTAWRNTMYSPQPPPQLPTYHQPVYKPISSPYPPQQYYNESSSMRQSRNNHHHSQSSYDYYAASKRDPYSYSGSSSFKHVGPQSTTNHHHHYPTATTTPYYDGSRQSHQYKHYPPPPQPIRPSPPSEHSNVRFQTDSSRHYYDRNAPTSSSFRPINEMVDNTSLNGSPSSFSEDNRYGRFVNPKFM